MRRKKTKGMKDAEARLGAPLEIALPPMITAEGQTGTADRIGVSKATLGYWVLKLDIEVRRVALAPGDRLVLHRQNGEIEEIHRWGASQR